MSKFNCEDETLYLFTITERDGTAYRVAGRLCDIAEGLPGELYERYGISGDAGYAVMLEGADEDEAAEAGVPVGGSFWRLYDGEASATPPTVTWSRVCDWLLSVFDVPGSWLTSEELPLFEVK